MATKYKTKPFKNNVLYAISLKMRFLRSKLHVQILFPHLSKGVCVCVCVFEHLQKHTYRGNVFMTLVPLGAHWGRG